MAEQLEIPEHLWEAQSANCDCWEIQGHILPLLSSQKSKLNWEKDLTLLYSESKSPWWVRNVC